MKYTFICNYGQNRGPTAVRVTRELAQERKVELEAEFRALFPEESGEYEGKVAEELKISDRIFVMTPKIGEVVRQRYQVPQDKITCLDIEDVYACHGSEAHAMTKILEDILRVKLNKWIR